MRQHVECSHYQPSCPKQRNSLVHITHYQHAHCLALSGNAVNIEREQIMSFAHWFLSLQHNPIDISKTHIIVKQSCG